MTERLTGIELIDCARANAKQGVVISAHLCGYEEDVETFAQELWQACHHIGVEISEFSDLISEPQILKQQKGISIQPDSPSEL